MLRDDLTKLHSQVTSYRKWASKIGVSWENQDHVGKIRVVGITTTVIMGSRYYEPILRT